MAVINKVTTAGEITMAVNGSPPLGNALATAALALSPGGSVSFSPSTLSLLQAVDILDWCVRWHWDAAREVAWLICKRAEDGNLPPHRLYKYVASTNTFTLEYSARLTDGGASGTGHGYDNATVDPATGDFYFLANSAENVLKWNGSGWTVATGNVTGGTGAASSVRGIHWHPNLYGTGDGGLVQMRGANMRAWRKSTGASGLWPVIYNPLPYTALQYNQGVFCEALGELVMTCGNYGLELFRTARGSTPTGVQMPFNLPVICSSTQSNSDADMSRLVQTPSGSLAVLESADAARVWRMNTTTFQWELQSFTHPLRLSSNSSPASWPTMFVSTYGVYWAIRENNGGNSLPSSILWRPPNGF